MLTDEQEREIIRMYCSAEQTRKWIYIRYKLNWRSFGAILKKHNVPNKTKSTGNAEKRRISDQELFEIAEACRRAPVGTTFQEIANQCGRCIRIVKRAITTHNVKMKVLKNHTKRNRSKEDMNRENKNHQAWLRKHIVPHTHPPLSATSLAGL